MKFMQWLLKIALTVILVSALTVFTTGMVVNTYLESVLAKFNIQLEGQTFTWGGMLQGMLGMNTTSEDQGLKDINKDQTQGIKSQGDSKEVSDQSVEQNKDGQSGPKSQPITGDEAPVDALPVMGQNQSKTPDSKEQNNLDPSKKDQLVIVTPDDLVRKKDKLPVSEKEELFNILMTKLPQQEVQNISSAMENGLTELELKSIEETLSKYLSQEEYDKLMALLKS